MTNQNVGESWEQLSTLIDNNDEEQLKDYLESLPSSETAWAVSRLSHDHQTKLLNLLSPEDAASIIEDIGSQQAVDIIDELPPDKVATIVEEMESNEQADFLSELKETEADAILDQMASKDAKDIRKLMQYPSDSVGGLMNTEFLSFTDTLSVGEVYDELSQHGEEFSDYDIQYIFVVTRYKMLVGVLLLRNLIFSSREVCIADLMITNPINIKVDTPLNVLIELFEDHNFIGVPVTDKKNRLIGIVRRSAVLDAVEKRESRSFLHFAGIIGGEELRSMPIRTRSTRRLSWLSINIVLNLIAASVIAAYEETLTQVIALAFFLPIISDMSGCSGNQAVAVSMRELTRGLLKPKEIFYVLLKEFPIGIINGVLLGMLIGLVAAVWQWNLALGAVVGIALSANTIVSVCLGGSIPLILKAVKLDPALVSSPVLTTVTDMCGFFFVLSFASYAMQWIK